MQPIVVNARVFSPELIEAIRAVSAIEQVIAEHVQLRRSGVQLAGRCPLHADKTPSFYVHPDKAVFRCHGCGAGGDVFRFVQLLHGRSFREAVQYLAARAGMRDDDFQPSPELTARVAGIKAQREDELSFKRFCNERIENVSGHYRRLGRAATHAEDCLRAGEADPHIHDLAWAALERFITFAARIEREGLCDLNVLRTEWSKLREAA
jgi:hypothetical protein